MISAVPLSTVAWLGARMVPLGILMGLCAAVAWGLSDFLLRGVSHAGGSPTRSLLGISLAAALGLSGVLPFTDALGRVSRAPLPLLGLAALLGLLLVLANVFLYRALAQGSVALVAPIANSHAAVTVLISLLAGARLTLPTVGAVVLICSGVALTSLPSSPLRSHGARPGQPRCPECVTMWPVMEVRIAWTPLALAGGGSAPQAWGSPTAAKTCGRADPRQHLRLAQMVARLITVEPDRAVVPAALRTSSSALPTLFCPRVFPTKEARPGTTLLSAMQQRYRLLSPSLVDALSSAVLLGVVFWAMQFVAPAVGPTAAAWMLRAGSAVQLSLWVGIGSLRSLGLVLRGGVRERLAPCQPVAPGHFQGGSSAPARFRLGRCWHAWRSSQFHSNWSRWSLVAGVGLLDAIATLSYGAGVTTTSAVLVATPASLSPVITVTLAYVLLRERLADYQVGGVIMALGGVVLLSAAL